VDTAYPRRLDEGFARDLASWLPPDRRYLVAVSGGRDSVVLLDFLLRHGWRDIDVVHVNHRLRGEASDGDEQFVRDLADRLGVDCECRRVDTRALAEHEGLSLETAARELRYAALAEVAEVRQCSRVLLAHHADDQVETILMQLFRGAGTRGLSGMDLVSTRRIGTTPLELIRPFLEIPREEMDRYFAEYELHHREDETNRLLDSTRNRVRHRLRPLLDEIFERDIRPVVLRAADHARRDEDYFREHLPDLPKSDSGEGLDVERLRELPPAPRDRLLLEWLREEGVPNCGAREVRLVTGILLSDARPAKANLPGDHHIRRRQGVLFLEGPRNTGDA